MKSDFNKKEAFFSLKCLFLSFKGNNDRMNLDWKRMEVLANYSL